MTDNAEVPPAEPGAPVTLDPAVTRPRKSHKRKEPAPAEAPPAAAEAVPVPVDRLPNRIEVALQFADNPLARILAWVETHGLPAVDQLHQLVSLAEHVAARQARQKFTQAFATLQHTLKPVTPTSTSSFGAYASLGDIVQATREPLAAQGFALSFRLIEGEGGVELQLVTLLSHVDGHTETCTVTVPVEVGPVSSRTGEAVRSVAQARAAAVTAARRLSVLTLLNLTTGESEQPDPAVAQGPVVPEGAADAEKALQAVTSREQLLEVWGKLPFVMRRYFQAEKPQLVEDLKTKYPEAPPAQAPA